MANCSVFSISTPWESHLEDEAFITTHCLPPYVQVTIYSLGLALFGGLTLLTLIVFLRALQVNGLKMNVLMITLGVYSLGMLWQTIWFICLILHTGFVLRYIAGGINFILMLLAIFLLSYAWWRVMITADCFSTFSNQLEYELKRIKVIFVIVEAMIVVIYIIMWTLNGVFRQQGQVKLSNMFLAMNLMILGLTALAAVFFWWWMIFQFKRIIFASEMKHSEVTLNAVKKIQASAIQFIMAGLVGFFMILGIFIWYLATLHGQGMANFIYVMFLTQCVQVMPALVLIKVNYDSIQRTLKHKQSLH